jgi:hypothetical protein
MAKATRVLSTPPTSTSARHSRRSILGAIAGSAAAGGSVAALALPTAKASEADPIYAAIERHRKACAAHNEAIGTHMDFEEVGMTGEKLEKYNRLVAETDAAYDRLDDVGCDLITPGRRRLPAFWRSVDTSTRYSQRTTRRTCRNIFCTTTTPRRPQPKRFAM